MPTTVHLGFASNMQKIINLLHTVHRSPTRLNQPQWAPMKSNECLNLATGRDLVNMSAKLLSSDPLKLLVCWGHGHVFCFHPSYTSASHACSHTVHFVGWSSPTNWSHSAAWEFHLHTHHKAIQEIESSLEKIFLLSTTLSSLLFYCLICFWALGILPWVL